MPAKNRKKTGKKPQTFGFSVTIFLWALAIGLVSVFWALFISGPVRLHDAQLAATEQVIREAVPGIRGLEQNIFTYVTWQGYTEETLYWFDNNGGQLTTRGIETLDYDAAKENAKENYNIEADSIELAFGYDSPVYELHGSGKLLMLDYDTLTRIYEREDKD